MTGEDRPRWRRALDRLWRRNRVHVGPDTSRAYRELAALYPPSELLSVRSGERSGSWTAPPAWHVAGARLLAPDGAVVVDWAAQPLGLYAYSPPFTGTVSRAELEEHLFSIPADPARTPFHFRNQYRHWAPEWGFCLPHQVRQDLPDGDYRVEIDTHFEAGALEMVEQVHHGELEECLLLVGHFDHPFMCNDGLVGCLAGHEAITRLGGRRTNLTYRMLSTIEIIGSVFYVERWAPARRVREALFVSTSGTEAPLAYQTSFGAQAAVDRAVRHVLGHASPGAAIHAFQRGPIGNDEIAFDVVGGDIPCGSLMRAPFRAYHTDADTPDNVHDDAFEESVRVISRVIDLFEKNALLEPHFRGLPCLSAPELDLYLSGATISQTRQPVSAATRAFLDRLEDDVRRAALARFDRLSVLMRLLPCMADGAHTTLDVAEEVGLDFAVVDAYTDLWAHKGLLHKRWVNPLT
jgi:aminopeptidase-like protein